MIHLKNISGLMRWLPLLVAMLFYSTSAISADYYCDFSVGGIYYQFIPNKPGEVAVSYDNYESGRYGGNYTNYSGYITVPSTVTYNSVTYRVTAVTGHAFYECSSVTYVSLPSTITSIGACAFTDCTSLTGINLPSSLKSIGNSAFNGCIGLNSMDIPSGVETIGASAFQDCQNLSSINIPNTVKSIGGSAFAATAWYNNQPDGMVYAGNVAYTYKGTMPQNTEIVLRDGTISISASAFSGRTGLTSVSIPKSVTSVGSSAFYACSALNKVIIQDIAAWCNINFDIANSNPLIYAHHLYNKENVEITSLVIPNGVTKIGDYAFQNCTDLTSVSIPNSVTSIGYNAFYGCTNLNLVDIPDSAVDIGTSAFSGTAWYNNMPDGVVYYGKVAYTYKGTMQQNTSIVLKDGTLKIKDNAFYGCSSLSSIIIPNSVTSIGEKAFQGCSSLASVIIPNSVTSIGEYNQEIKGETNVEIIPVSA